MTLQRLVTALGVVAAIVAPIPVAQVFAAAVVGAALVSVAWVRDRRA